MASRFRSFFRDCVDPQLPLVEIFQVLISGAGVADDVMPVLDGELRGEDGSAARVAVVEHLDQVVTALV